MIGFKKQNLIRNDNVFISGEMISNDLNTDRFYKIR